MLDRILYWFEDVPDWRLHPIRSEIIKTVKFVIALVIFGVMALLLLAVMLWVG